MKLRFTPYSTVKLTTAFCAIPDPPTAETVAVYRPAAALLVAVSVNADVPAPGAASNAGAKLANTPAGNPLTASVTGVLHPPLRLTRALTFALAPRATATAPEDKLK